ncbi:MAG TPA: alpha-ketoacid dehydrogenase subunit beta [Dehalococcoidia bacterium]|nr:alpha-ketoacid dehydrogenase subunit beta [Dehalococcoidia bacterium]
MAERSVIEAVRDGMSEMMTADDRIFVLGEDVQEGGVFRATEGFLDKFGPQRVLDTPLAEASIVGVAIGAALNGLRPIAEIQFADFIHPAMDQILSEASRLRYRSVGDWNCPLVIRTPWGGGIHGALYHSQSIESIYAHIPGLKVVTPAFPEDFKGMIKSAIEDPDPVLFLEHKKLYRSIKTEVPDEDYRTPIGPAVVRREGEDVTVFAYGLMLHESLTAAETLAGEGISAEVVDLRSLRPLDKETILNSAKKTGKILVVYEDNLTGGFGAEISAIIAQEAFEYLDAPIVRLAGPDIPTMPYAPPLEHFYMPDAEKISAALRELAAY